MSARGLGLIEALVALAVLAIAAALALDLLDRGRRAFHRGENLLESRQGVRAGWRRMVGELRAAGLAHDPDGDPRRPDEAIEAAYDTAIVFRADLDAHDPARSDVPEAALASGMFATVPIGNDEIVGYALARPDGSGPDVLTFEADVLEPARDGDVETVRVTDLALVHDAPPYTLYRFTLNADPASGPLIVRAPVVDDLRRLTIRYLDERGVALHPGGAESARAERARIRRVEITLEGMTRDPDPATGLKRRFELSGSVVPRNLVRRGRAELP